MHYPVVIIGSGFAGRTIASYFAPEDCLILERGEKLDYGAAIERARRALSEGKSLAEAEALAYQSRLPWNQTPRLSGYNYSRYALVGGGSSNWWGGKCSRLSSYVFEARDTLPWLLSRQEMEPYYALAERTLNVSGDPVMAEGEPVSAMPGAAYWRNALSPHFGRNHIYNVAINHGKAGQHGQGTCTGRSACAICYNDAKARPDNIFAEQNILYESMVTEIIFDGERARSVQVYNGREVFEVTFDTLIVAANGLESPRLLARSSLPSAVKREWIGKHLQDHAHFALTCKIPGQLAFRNLGGLAHLQIKELSRPWSSREGEIETGVLALTHPVFEPQVYASGVNLGRLERLDDGAARRLLTEDFRGVFRLYGELEITPALGGEVNLETECAHVIDERTYPRAIRAFDEVLDQIKAEVRSRGIQILKEDTWYRGGYGGHHFCGTLNMSDSERSVVDGNAKLIGTENVYCAGASIVPRSGGVAPTLTLVALAHRLGQHLCRN